MAWKSNVKTGSFTFDAFFVAQFPTSFIIYVLENKYRHAGSRTNVEKVEQYLFSVPVAASDFHIASFFGVLLHSSNDLFNFTLNCMLIRILASFFEVQTIQEKITNWAQLICDIIFQWINSLITGTTNGMYTSFRASFIEI